MNIITLNDYLKSSKRLRVQFVAVCAGSLQMYSEEVGVTLGM